MQKQHVTSTPMRVMPVVREGRVKIKRPPEGFSGSAVNEYRSIYSSAPVVAAPPDRLRVVITGDNMDLVDLFAERFNRAGRMAAAKKARNAA
jgi:hypothetical protein